MSLDLPPQANLEHLRKQAKKLLRDFQSGSGPAVEQIRPLGSAFTPGGPRLADAQRAVARAYGFESWPKLKEHIESLMRAAEPVEAPASVLKQEVFVADSLQLDSVDDGAQDDLLPLLRKSRFDKDLPMLLGQAGDHAPLGLLFFDLDFFKQVNDGHGHLAGDEVLVAVASAVRAVCSAKGRCYRWGGKEFAVLLPNHTSDEAASVADRIRLSVSKLAFKSYPGKMTLSVGVSCYPETSASAELLVKDADAAMYEAKRGGRDRVVTASNAPNHSPQTSGPSRTSPRQIDKNWLERRRTAALSGIKESGKPGFMEIYHFCVDSAVTKPQSELLSVAEQSAIHTFGWPIGIVLRNREEFRPRPSNDGITAHIDSGHDYDYWALGTNGDFYALMSLFEDERTEKTLFFDTRIVRVTEAILHCINIYKIMGMDADRTISLACRHVGLLGRKLLAASPNRVPSMHARLNISEDVVQTSAEFRVGVSESEIINVVKSLCEPLFVVFDFGKFRDEIYKEIVLNFIQGRVV